MKNKFKIVIPSYNNEQWVETNIESILEQTYDNYEVLDVPSNYSVRCVKSEESLNPKAEIFVPRIYISNNALCETRVNTDPTFVGGNVTELDLKSDKFYSQSNFNFLHVLNPLSDIFYPSITPLNISCPMICLTTSSLVPNAMIFTPSGLINSGYDIIQQKNFYISDSFLTKGDMHLEEVSQVLNDIRRRNLNNVLISDGVKYSIFLFIFSFI